MVTGDQPTTATAIAKKVSIITTDSVYIHLNMDTFDQEAFKAAEACVIHGDVLAKMHMAFEQLTKE